MKIKLADRLLMALYALFGVLLSLGIGALILFRDDFALNVGPVLITMPTDLVPLLIIAAAALALLLWSIRMLMLIFRRESKVDKSSVSVQATENGSVRVSVQAMDMLVRRAVSNTEGVADVKTSIVNHEDSISVHVDMTLNSDVYIPNVTMLMQRNIKSFIEEYSGIAVREVTIMVSKIIEVNPQPPLRIQEPRPEPIIIDQEEDAAEPEGEQEQPEVEAQPSDEVDGGADPIEDEEEALPSDDEAISEKDFW